MTHANTWFDKLATLSKVEGEGTPSINKTANSKLEIRNSKQFSNGQKSESFKQA